jgi:hypothetical protein
MSGLPETPLFEEEIYQIEDTDYASGGPSGHPNTSMRQLANRTTWLRQALLNMGQAIQVVDDDGVRHDMVWIPTFRIPAGALGGRPSQDLVLGGFAVDQYPSALIGAKAVSQFGRVPEQVTVDQCAARVIRGKACTMMSFKEWGHLAWLVDALGRRDLLRGNLASGRDPRDPDAPEFYAQPGVAGEYGAAHRAGTGPLSWSHSGLWSGVWDLIGGVGAIMGSSPWPDGELPGVSYGACILVRSGGVTLNADIDDDDADFVVEVAPGHSFERWPEADGLVLFHHYNPDTLTRTTEVVTYQSLATLVGEPTKRTLVGCVRGAFGTGAKAWTAGANLWCEQRHNILPGSYTGLISGAGLNNDTPGSATFAWDWGVYAHGLHADGPNVGDVLCAGLEDLLVTYIDGASVTVTRGHNGTPIEAHADGSVVVAYPDSTKLARPAQGEVGGYAVGPPLAVSGLEDLYLPADFTTAAPAGDTRESLIFRLDSEAGQVVWRGAPWNAGQGTSMMNLIRGGVDGPGLLGGRCVWRP